MSTAPREPDHARQRELANRIDVICDEFEMAWRGGDRPEIEVYLLRLPEPDRPRLLRELLSLELDLLPEKPGEPATYLARFPQAARIVHEVFACAAKATPALSLVSLARFLGREEPSLSAPLAELQRIASESHFAQGEYLIRQGEEATSLMVIRQGDVEIRVEDSTSSTHVIGRAGPGQVLGEMALLTSEPCTASAVASEVVRAAMIPAESFHQLVGRYPELSSLLIDLIAERLGTSYRDALTDKQLDRYRIQGRLGRGGMSVVYEALDTTTDERVALKMMSHRLVNSAAALRRFQFEADLIERLDHSHIVRMLRRFAAFRTYFIVMEFVAGETLATYLERSGPVEEITFRGFLGQLAQAIQYAHEEGVVHRDIKPANVMHLRDGSLKLMDFGLAEPIAGAAHEMGEVVGTPRYMSPEQRIGATIDHRSDYFSLGCLAYELLTASPLFTREAIHEPARDFGGWEPPDFTQLGTPLSESTAGPVRQLLAINPAERGVDLGTIASWVK